MPIPSISIVFRSAYAQPTAVGVATGVASANLTINGLRFRRQDRCRFNSNSWILDLVQESMLA
jgi:hypothetical protein